MNPTTKEMTINDKNKLFRNKFFSICINLKKRVKNTTLDITAYLPPTKSAYWDPSNIKKIFKK